MDAQRIVGAVIIGVWSLARVFFARRAGGRSVVSERMPVRRRVLLVLVSAGLVPIYLYYFTAILDPFTVPVPPWVGWAGDVLLAASVLLFIWSHAALGRSWSARVELAAGQALVTRGPYRWVRHPMYSALILMGLGLVPATANPIASLPYLVSIATMYLDRVEDEERLMLESFGEEYAAYIRHTGRLLPKGTHDDSR